MAKKEGAFSGKRLSRILQLHRLLRTGRAYGSEALIEACREVDPEVHARTIASDIAFLRDVFQAPLPERANKWSKYRYERDYSLFEGLDDSFAGTLQEVLALVRQLARKPEFLGLEEVLLRLEQRAGGLVGNPADDRLQFEEPILTGREKLPGLYRSILIGQTLDIVYQPFERPKRDYRIRPCLLREHNKRWFLFAWCEGMERIQNYPVDRLVSVTSAAEPMPERAFDAKHYFANLIGVTVFEPETKPVDVVLRIEAARAGYIVSKKLHDSQQEAWNEDGSLTVTLRILLNRELDARLLELGADVEVIEPFELREGIKKVLERALRRYH